MEHGISYGLAISVHILNSFGVFISANENEDALGLRNPGLRAKWEKETLLWTLEGYPGKLMGRPHGQK